jgi:DNA-binding transcriptional MerR regulator
MGLVDIGEVARRTGLPPSTLRYYEEAGLVASAGRAGLRRQYGPDALERLAVIRLCRAAGFTVRETAALLDTAGGPAWRAIARRKLDDVRARLAHLEAAATRLEHALTCPSPNLLDCPHFRWAVAGRLEEASGPPGDGARDWQDVGVREEASR